MSLTLTGAECRADGKRQVKNALNWLRKAIHSHQAALYLEGCPVPDAAHKAVMGAIDALRAYPSEKESP